MKKLYLMRELEPIGTFNTMQEVEEYVYKEHETHYKPLGINSAQEAFTNGHTIEHALYHVIDLEQSKVINDQLKSLSQINKLSIIIFDRKFKDLHAIEQSKIVELRTQLK